MHLGTDGLCRGVMKYSYPNEPPSPNINRFSHLSGIVQYPGNSQHLKVCSLNIPSLWSSLLSSVQPLGVTNRNLPQQPHLFAEASPYLQVSVSPTPWTWEVVSTLAGWDSPGWHLGPFAGSTETGEGGHLHRTAVRMG